MKRLIAFILLLLAACQSSPPAITAALAEEFTLAPGQTATLTGEELTIQLAAVEGDDRCPHTVECVASGPVTLRVTLEAGATSPGEFVMQTFTGYTGRAPEGPFEGIRDRLEFSGYQVRVVAVLPYPEGFGDQIHPGAYRVTFIVTRK